MSDWIQLMLWVVGIVLVAEGIEFWRRSSAWPAVIFDVLAVAACAVFAIWYVRHAGL